jgi:hypothetical protein
VTLKGLPPPGGHDGTATAGSFLAAPGNAVKENAVKESAVKTRQEVGTAGSGTTEGRPCESEARSLALSVLAPAGDLLDQINDAAPQLGFLDAGKSLGQRKPF